MLRASIAAEKAGYPTVSIVGSLFEPQAKLIAGMAGIDEMPLAVYPGRIPMDDEDTFREKVSGTITAQVVDQFTGGGPRLKANEAEPGPRDAVFTGSLDDVTDHFYAQGWTDGLPIVPPTVDRIEPFLRFTHRAPDESLGVLQPEQRDATIWSIAANGVMAGCRPEYMPVMVALVSAIADPEFRLPDAASGVGWEPIVTVSGPIIRDLDFNFGTGVARIGRRANSTLGRFLRLVMRNIAGLRPGITEKGGIGENFRVLLAEDEETVRALGWPTLGDDTGIPDGQSSITVQSVFGSSVPMGEYEEGGSDDPYTYLRPIVEFFGKGVAAYWTHCGITYGGFSPLVLLSPHAAKVLARHGWTKEMVREYLFQEARTPARPVLARGRYTGMDLEAQVAAGHVSEEFLRSDDPDRLIPVFLDAKWTRIMVAGNPDMYWQQGFVSNHAHGSPVTRIVELPLGWVHRD